MSATNQPARSPRPRKEIIYTIETDLSIDEVVRRLRDARDGKIIVNGEILRVRPYGGTILRTWIYVGQQYERVGDILPRVRGTMYTVQKRTRIDVEKEIFNDAVLRWTGIFGIACLILLMTLIPALADGDWPPFVIWTAILVTGLTALILRRARVYPRLLKDEVTNIAKIIDARLVENPDAGAKDQMSAA